MKYFKAILITLFFGSPVLNAQDIFDAENSYKFALHLYNNSNFTSALHEFNRVVFIDTTNLDAKYKALNCHYRLQQYHQGVQYFKNLQSHGLESVNDSIEVIYGKLLLKSHPGFMINDFINNSKKLHPSQKSFFKVSGLLLNEQWSEGKELLSNINNGFEGCSEYQALVNSYHIEKFKSPGVSMLFSSVIPGSGKVYSGYWKDGLFSLLFVATSVWQAYSGFDKNGIESVYGWAFATIGFSFYIGNIYGSGKAVHKYNGEIKHGYYHKVNEVFEKSYRY